jgi:hypothetical protein
VKTGFRFVRSGIWGFTCAVSLFALQVEAVTIYTLPPGGSMSALATSYPVGVGPALATATSPFNNGALSGTLFSSVYSGDTANPYPGGLTFTYQLSIAPGSPDSSSEMTVSSFSSFHTDVSYHTAGADVNPSNFTRDSGAGDTLRFVFLSQSILPGETSALVVVQTDAASFHSTSAGIIDGLTVNVPSLAPLAVPEPATFSLVLAGLGLLGFRNRFRKG